MKIYTKIIIDHTGKVIEEDWYEYSGPIAACKGDASKKEQAAADQQRAMENQLMQQQLAMQQAQLNSVNATVDPIISQITQGQTPNVLQPLQSALTASYMNQLPNTYRNATAAINQNLVARGLSGGQNAGGGGIAQDYGQMAAMLGQQQQAGALDAAQIMNQQSLGLLNTGLGLKMGIGGQFGGNVGNFNSGAQGALNAGVTAANNVDQAQTSWMGPVFGALGAMGGALTTGGMKNLGAGKGFFG